MDFSKLSKEDVEYILDNIDKLKAIKNENDFKHLNLTPGKCLMFKARSEVQIYKLSKVSFEDLSVVYDCIIKFDSGYEKRKDVKDNDLIREMVDSNDIIAINSDIYNRIDDLYEKWHSVIVELDWMFDNITHRDDK